MLAAPTGPRWVTECRQCAFWGRLLQLEGVNELLTFLQVCASIFRGIYIYPHVYIYKHAYPYGHINILYPELPCVAAGSPRPHQPMPCATFSFLARHAGGSASFLPNPNPADGSRQDLGGIWLEKC